MTPLAPFSVVLASPCVRLPSPRTGNRGLVEAWAILRVLIGPLEALARDGTKPRSLRGTLQAGKLERALSATEFIFETGGV